MPRNQPRSNNAERDATQAMAGQPRSDDDEDSLQQPDDVPSFLTAQELQARDPAKADGRDDSDEEEPAAESDEPKARKKPSGKSR
jgi:hypothetical protein